MAFTIGTPECSAPRKHTAGLAEFVASLLRPAEPRGRNDARHQEGLRLTASVLATLPQTYVVFNDFRPPRLQHGRSGWLIDHVVIGPSGVFAIQSELSIERLIAPAAESRTTAQFVRTVQHRAAEFREALTEWSCASLGDVFVKPMLVFANDGVYVEKLQEGPVKVIPLRWLTTEVTERTFEQLTPDQVYRIAHALFEQLPENVQRTSQPELDRLGVIAGAWLSQQVYPQLVLPIPLD